MRRKWRCTFFMILLALVLGGCSTACDVDKASEEENAMEAVSEAIEGGPVSYQEILWAEEIKNLDKEYELLFPLDKLFSGENKYEDLHYIMCHLMKTYMEDEDFKFYGETGCYFSKVPFFWWDAYQKKWREDMGMGTFAFSKDKKKVFSVYFIRLQPKGDLHVDVAEDDRFFKLLKKNPGCKYIPIKNGYDTALLDEENRLTMIGEQYEEFCVEGDYYHVLDGEKNGISYKELTNPDNLVWIDLKDLEE